MSKFLPFLLLMVSYNLIAQNSDLLSSITHSGIAQVFEITDDQAYEIYKNSDHWNVESAHLNKMITTIPIDSNINEQLTSGHYLKIYSQNNQLKTEVLSIPNCNIEVGNNQSDLFIKIWHEDSEIVDAQVFVKNRKIKYNEELKGYWKKKTNKSGLLEVVVDGRRWFYLLDKQYQNSRFKRIKRKVVYGTPLKHIITPPIFILNLPIDGYKSVKNGYPQGGIYRIKNFGRKAYKKVACLFDDYHCSNDYSDKFKGYFITNKPKYRPGDTVRFKSLILNKKGKYTSKDDLNIYLWTHYSKSILIGKAKPYRKGAYKGQFILHDSLGLKLDKTYKISLGKNDYKSKAVEWFKLEDYELKSIDLKLRTDGSTIYKDSLFTIYAEGIDENGLTIPDGKLSLYATTVFVDDLWSKEVFIPDTLWTYNGALKPNGETEIVFPDSLLPKANIDLSIYAELRNSENELAIDDLKLTYLTAKELKASLVGDSLLFDYKINGNSTPISAIRKTKNDGILPVQLPLKIEVSHLIDRYEFEIEGKRYFIDSKDHRPKLNTYTSRNRDSIAIKVDNPSKVPFTYFIYKLNKLIEKGHSDQLNYVISKPGKEKYYFHIQHLWGGEVHTEDYEIPYLTKKISLNTTLPTTAYPGMETEVEVIATDEKGKPMSDVDISVYSITKKFKEHPVQLEQLTRSSNKFKHLINVFEVNEIHKDLQQTLKFRRWAPILGLDSIAYYHFLYPKSSYYQYASETSDSSTQIAPFAVSQGEVLTSHVIYIDDKPTYFSWNTQPDRYAFTVSPGYHKITIRTDSLELKIDSIYCENGLKTIISLPAKQNDKVEIKEMSNYLTKYERVNLYRYILPYRSLFNSPSKFGYFHQNGRYYQVTNKSKYHNLSGPVNADYITLQFLEDYQLKFEHESGFEYDFSPNLLKMRSFEHYPSLSKRPPQSIHDTPLTLEDLKEQQRIYKERLRLTSRVYRNPISNANGRSSLHILTSENRLNQDKIVNTLLFKLDDIDFIRVYPGKVANYFNLDSGYYRVIQLKKDKSYDVIDSLRVKQGGRQYHQNPITILNTQDLFSLDLDSLLNELTDQRIISSFDKQAIQQRHSRRYQYNGIGDTFEGYVTSAEDGEALPGVTVYIKGMTIGTTTDLNGYYRIKAPRSSILVFAFVGMSTEEVETGYNETIDVQMAADVMQLSEVVVSGYAASVTKRNLSASVSTVLQGKVAGVSIQAAYGAINGVQIRGSASMSSTSERLVIVDGVIMNDSSEIDESKIENISILKEAAATAIYGSRAAGGVILITTKGYKSATSSIDKEIPFNSVSLQGGGNIRNNFKDYAIWQPDLRSDKSGRVSFTMSLPDDITNWSTTILAYGKGRRTGQVTINTKSTLPIAGRLAVPRFLMPGDSVYVQGKTVNYSGIPQDIRYTFLNTDVIKKSGQQSVENFALDSLLVSPTMANDTLEITYTIENENGFKDGEQRDVIVKENGISISKGYFLALDSDTTITLNFPDSLGSVSLYAASDLRNVLLAEVKSLQKYPYECNEQLASKLIAFCVYNYINKEKQGHPFYKQKVKQIIKKLRERQSREGYWGWWSEHRSTPWVTTHVVRALKLAENLGLNPNYNYKPILENTLWELNKKYDTERQIHAVNTMLLLDSAADVTPNINSFYTKWGELSINQKFRVWSIEQSLGKRVSKDSVLKYSSTDVFNNMYFDNTEKDKRYSFRESDILTTLEGYKLLDQLGEKKLAGKVVNYIISKRKSGGWLNTYESSLIIAALRKEINGLEKDNNSLVLSGMVDEKLSKFPYDTASIAPGSLTITKKGNNPVYFTGYQQERIKNPKANIDHFVINTYFDNADNKNLKAGEIVKMTVSIDVLKDSEFVAIDVPIPASCTYVSKQKGNETHREYYRDKVGFYYRKLAKGKHTIKIELIARFSGSFTQNPAKAHWMYFPTIDGWNETKTIKVY